MKIISADEENSTLLGGLNKQLVEDEGHDNPMGIDELADRMARWLNGDYRAHLLYDGSDVVAYCLWRDDGEHIYVRQLFTIRVRRRQGIGRMFVKRLRYEIWPERRIRLEVLCDNTSAIAFYDALGFSQYSITMELNC